MAEPVTPPDDDGVTASEPTWTRDEVLARYRHVREVSKRLNSELVRYVSQDALLQQARRLGLARGKTFVVDNEDDMTFVFDLVIHTAPPDRTRAIDRYARSAKLDPASDEARVLEAMRHAQFSILNVQSRHETAGLIVKDVLRGTAYWLVDIGMEKTMPVGATIASRIYQPDRFWVTAGVNVPIDRSVWDEVFKEVPQLLRKSPEESAEHRRLAEAVYRVAIAFGVTKRMRHEDPLSPAG